MSGHGEWQATTLPLVGHTLRAMRWQPFVIAAVLAALVGRYAGAFSSTLAAMTFACGAALALDDDAAVTLAASPTSVWRRRVTRLVVVLVAQAALWPAVLIIMSTGDAPMPPTWVATTEVVVLTLVVLAASATFGGAVAAPIMLALVAVAAMLPQRFALYPIERHEVRWLIVAAVAAATIAWTSRDGARRGRVWTRLRRREPRGHAHATEG